MFKSCLIAGLGLMGGSLALAMREKGLATQFYGLDANPEHCKKALQHKMVDKIVPQEMPLPPVDLIALCTPVGAYRSILSRLPRDIPSFCLIIDIASVKQIAVKEVLETLPKDMHGNYVPCHPIAGGATYGPDAANAKIYNERDIILTPHPNVAERQLERARGLWRMIGASTRMMTPEKHDIAYAYVSHLPQLLAYAFLLAYGEENLSPGGLQRFLRIGGSSPELWTGIFLANRGPLLLALDDFQLEMRRFQSFPAYAQMQFALRGVVGEYENYSGPGFRDFTSDLMPAAEKKLPPNPLPLHHEIAHFHNLLVEGNPEKLLIQLRKAKSLHNRCFG